MWRLPSSEDTGWVLRLCHIGSSGESCCLPAVHYLTREKATASDKRWQEVPLGVTVTLSEPEKGSRSLFSWYKENALLAHCMPSRPSPGSLLRGFQRPGLSQPRHGDAALMSGISVRGSPSKTHKESQTPTHPTACVSCPHAPQGCPLSSPRIQISPTPWAPTPATALPSPMSKQDTPGTQTLRIMPYTRNWFPRIFTFNRKFPQMLPKENSCI